MSDARLLNDGGLWRKLGISRGTFYHYKRLGAFKVYEVKRPIGQFRYSSLLVDQLLAGQPVSTYGKRHP